MTATPVDASRETIPERIQPPRQVVSLPVDRIKIGPNVRVDVAGIDELAASIESLGVLQPIKVRAAGDDWVVVWGQRRLLAVQKLGWKRIPAITTAEQPTAAEIAIEQLVENLHRADLNPIDRAAAMRAVVDAGTTQAELARTLGLAPSTVANDLAMLAAPDEIRELIAQGQLSPAHQRAMKGLAPKSQISLAREVVAEGISAHQTEKVVRQRKAQAEREAKQRQEEAQNLGRRRTQLAESLAAEIVKKKVPLDAPVIVETSYGTQPTHVLELLSSSGFTNVRLTKGWNGIQARPAGVCDCTAWKASEEVTWHYDREQTRDWRVVLTKGCVEPKHIRAREAVAERTRRSKEATADAVQARVRQTGAGWAIPEARAIAVDRILAEAALFSLLSYRLPDWSVEHGGARTKPWEAIHGLPDAALAAELAKAIAADFRDHAGYHVDWVGLAAELGIEGGKA